MQVEKDIYIITTLTNSDRVLAKSYISYKQQIDELQEGNSELLKKLLDISIETLGKNPSDTLDKKHGDGTVLTEILNVKDLVSAVKDGIVKT